MLSLQKVIGSILGAATLIASPVVTADSGFIDSASLEFGSGARVKHARVAVQSNWDAHWFSSNGRHLSGYWDLSAAYWRGAAYRNVRGQRQNITVVGITPVLRYGREDKRGWYVEAGIGANVFSELYNNDDNRLSTAFQFGDHLGVGYVASNRWDFGVKIQHYSNASIKRPNSGVNFVVLGARYSF